MYWINPRPNWINQFSHLQGCVAPIHNEIYSFEIIRKEIQRFNLVLPMFSMLTYGSSLIAFIVFFAIAFYSYSLIDYLIYGLFWNFYCTGLASIASYGYVYINTGYFHLLCYSYQLKIESSNNRFKKIIQKST